MFIIINCVGQTKSVCRICKIVLFTRVCLLVQAKAAGKCIKRVEYFPSHYI